MKAILITLAITGAILLAGGLFNLSKSSNTQLYSSDVLDAWNTWKQTQNKSYGTNSNEAYRLSVFATHHANVKAANNNHSFTFKSALNRFSDLTVQEFKAQYTGYKHNESSRRNTMTLKNLDSVPATKDWVLDGAVTPVKDQGACGSCWAFSATGAMEGLNYILNKNLLSFSEQFFLNCNKHYPDMGCNGGNSAITMMWTETNGIITEDKMPYTAKVQNNCYWSKYTSDFFNKDTVDVPADDNDEMLKAINQQPVSIAVDAGLMMHYSSGIMNDWTCGTDLDHAILAVGYGVEGTNMFYKVKNSWNTTWGEAGYIRFARRAGKGTGMCGLTRAATYPIGQNPKP